MRTRTLWAAAFWSRPHALRLPAAVLRVEQRGVLRAGAFADIVILDARRIRDTATFQEPHQLAEGIVYVCVNGGLAVDEGQVADGRFGRVLTRR